MAVDVDLGVDLLAAPDEDDQLRPRLRAASQVVAHEPNVGNVDVAPLGHRRPADATAYSDEYVVGRSPDERPEPENVVGEQLVDSGPVKPFVQLVQAVDGRLQDVLERGSQLATLIEVGDDFICVDHSCNASWTRGGSRTSRRGRVNPPRNRSADARAFLITGAAEKFAAASPGLAVSY